MRPCVYARGCRATGFLRTPLQSHCPPSREINGFRAEQRSPSRRRIRLKVQPKEQDATTFLQQALGLCRVQAYSDLRVHRVHVCMRIYTHVIIDSCMHAGVCNEFRYKAYVMSD